MDRAASTRFSTASRLPTLESLLTEQQIARLRALAHAPKSPPENLDAASLLEWRLAFSNCGPGCFLPVFVREAMAMFEEDGALGRGPLRRAGLVPLSGAHRRVEGDEEQKRENNNSKQEEKKMKKKPKNKKSSQSRTTGPSSNSQKYHDDDAYADDDDNRSDASSADLSPEELDYYARHEKVYSHQDLLILLIRWGVAAGIRSRVNSGDATFDEGGSSGGANGSASGSGGGGGGGGGSAGSLGNRIWDESISSVVPPSEIRLTTAALLAPSPRALLQAKQDAEDNGDGRETTVADTRDDDDDDEDNESDGEIIPFSSSTMFQKGAFPARAPAAVAAAAGGITGVLLSRHDSGVAVKKNKKRKARVGAYWEVELRDYFIRWSELTTALLAGAARQAFDNSDATDGAVFQPYASTRVVRSLRKRAMAAARHALGQHLDDAMSEDEDEEDADHDGGDQQQHDDRHHRGDNNTNNTQRKVVSLEDKYFEDEDGRKFLKPRCMRRKNKKTVSLVEQLHHAPVTSAVVVPRLNAVCTGSLDGTVKLWSRNSGDFVKNIFCCSGKTTIVGVTCVPAGPSADVIVIGTSTSHLALYSTQSNSIVKEYCGTSEKRGEDVKWSAAPTTSSITARGKRNLIGHQHNNSNGDSNHRSARGRQSSTATQSPLAMLSPRPPSSTQRLGTRRLLLDESDVEEGNTQQQKLAQKEKEMEDVRERSDSDEEHQEHEQKQDGEDDAATNVSDEVHKLMEEEELKKRGHHLFGSAAAAAAVAEQDSRMKSSAAARGTRHANKIGNIPLRPTTTTSRYRSLPGTYGRRLIKAPPIGSAVDAASFFEEWRDQQDKEVLRTVPGAQIHNLSRLSLLQSIQPNLGEPSIVAFGTADGTVGLLDLNDEFVDAIMYAGLDQSRQLHSVAVVPTHTSTVTSIAYCNRHRCILSGAYDGVVQKRNIETSQIVYPGVGHETKAIAAMSWCEAQQLLATVTSDRKAYAWSFMGRRPIAELALESRPVSVIVHSRKSQMAVLCEDRQMLIYDTRTFRCLQGLSVVTDRAEREATIVVGGDCEDNALDVSTKSTLATLDSSSTRISPYDAKELHRGAGMLLVDGDDIVAVHREVSILKDELGKVSVRVKQDGKAPVYGFRFDVYDETLENAPAAAAGSVQPSTVNSVQEPASVSIGGHVGLGRRTSSSNPSQQTKQQQLQQQQQQHVLEHSNNTESDNNNTNNLIVSVSANFVGFEQDDPHASSLVRKSDASLSSTSLRRVASLRKNNSSHNLSPTATAGSPTSSATTTAAGAAARGASLSSRSDHHQQQQGDEEEDLLQQQQQQSAGSGSGFEKRKPSAALFCVTKEHQHQQPHAPIFHQNQLRPVLKAPPVGILYNKKNGMILVADADGFVSADVRCGEIIFCVASEKNLGHTTASLAAGLLVAQTQRIGWCPCDSGRMRGIQCDSFLSLSKKGVVTEWNAADGTALRVTESDTWAAELGPQMTRPRRDKPFSDMCVCEKMCAVAQHETVFVLNETVRRAPKMSVYVDNFDSIFAQIIQPAVAAATAKTGAAATALSPSASSPAVAIKSPMRTTAAAGAKLLKTNAGKVHTTPHPPRPTTAPRPVTSPGKATTKAAAAVSLHVPPTQDGTININSSSSSKVSSSRSSGTKPSFAGHNAFSIDAGCAVTAMAFSAGCEYLAIGTMRGLLHTVHVESSESIAMTLSMLRAGEPTSPIVAIAWNNHVGDCTVFAAVALGRVAAIHAPTNTVMLSLAVDLGPRHLNNFLSSLHVQRHQSRGGTALEALAIGDTGGVVRVVTLHVRKRGEILREDELRKELESLDAGGADAGGDDAAMCDYGAASLPKAFGSLRKKESTSGPGGAANSPGGKPRSRSDSAANAERRGSQHQQQRRSFVIQQLQRGDSGIEWSAPLAVSVLPADHKLTHLKSVRDLYENEETELERRNSLQTASFYPSEFRSDDDDDDTTDSDDENQQQLLLKTFSGGYAKRSAAAGRRSESQQQDDRKRSSTSTAVGGASTSTSQRQPPDGEISGAHQTMRAKVHEMKKSQRRLAMLHGESSSRVAAISKLRGTFSKRRKGFIFRDIYDFIEPDDIGGGVRPDPATEKPVWCGCIDGTLSLRALGCIGPVSQVQFLALRRLGVRHGMALIAASTNDGNVSLLRWSRLYDDEPSALVCLTRLRCPITAGSRGPFWPESLMSLQPPAKRSEGACSSAAAADSTSFFVTQQQQQQEPQRRKASKAPADPSAAATFASCVGVGANSRNNNDISNNTRFSVSSSSASQRRATLTQEQHQLHQQQQQQSPYEGQYRPLTEAEEADMKRQDEQVDQFLPSGLQWSPLGTGHVHETEDDLVYCLDDRWEQCTETELKPRDIGPLSKAEVKRRKSVRRRASAVAFTDMMSPSKRQSNTAAIVGVASDARGDVRDEITKRRDTTTAIAAAAAPMNDVSSEGTIATNGDVVQFLDTKPFGNFDDDIFGHQEKEHEAAPVVTRSRSTAPAMLVRGDDHAMSASLVPCVSISVPAGDEFVPALAVPILDAAKEATMKLRPTLSVSNMSSSRLSVSLTRAPSSVGMSSSGMQLRNGHQSGSRRSQMFSGIAILDRAALQQSREAEDAQRRKQQQEDDDEHFRREQEKAELEARERWHGLQLQKRTDTEKLQGAFDRLKQVRDDVRMRKTHPLLDKVHLKLEAADDVKREVQHKTEKESTPAWLERLREGQEPMPLNSVLLMSRPPPILLKRHKRV